MLHIAVRNLLDNNDTEGSGLALAIVTRIAEQRGARLSVCSYPAGGFVARIDGLKAWPLSPP